MDVVTRRPKVASTDADRRLQRLRRLAWWLDRSFGFGSRGRFGVDPLLGLLPGIGDWVGAALSLYIVYEAMRLGLSWPVLGRMVANIAIESLVGTMPVVGDAFDFYWQANVRNLRLVEQHHRAELEGRPLRSVPLFIGTLVLFLVALLAATLALAAWGIRELAQVVTSWF